LINNLGGVVNIVIREAELQDLDGVLVLAKQLATSFVVHGEPFQRSFKQILTMKSAQLLVAQKDNQLIGYLLGFEHPAFYANGTVSWVEELYIESEFRAEGVGKSLMHAFEKSEEQKGSRLVALATRRAELFYESIGYEKSATYFKKHL